MGKGSKNKKSTRDIIEFLAKTFLAKEMTKGKPIPDSAMGLMIMTDMVTAQTKQKVGELNEISDKVMDQLADVGSKVSMIIDKMNRSNADPAFSEDFIDKYNNLINRTNTNSDTIYNARQKIEDAIEAKSISTDQIMAEFSKGTVSPDKLVEALREVFKEVQRIVETAPDSILHEAQTAAKGQQQDERVAGKMEVEVNDTASRKMVNFEREARLSAGQAEPAAEEGPAQSGPSQDDSGTGFSPG
ncbi:MAG TPA: hypothetical protein VL360_07835 [Gammaproteobacteria bacterium]|jgi:hypothetical protein|nr:hypothetical protein [Gammaproteobacteria bacterium]